MATDADSLPPAFLRVRLAHDASVRRDAHVLAGGAPYRLMRLTDSGAEHVRRWNRPSGDLVGSDLGGRALARRLLDHGLLLSDGCDSDGLAGARPTADLDVVVPVHNRSQQLDRCLQTLAQTSANVVVVDDASSDADEIAEVVSRNGAQLIRLDVNRGAAAARNVGLRATTRAFVAFVDSDVTVPPGCLERLLTHFADPVVGIAAPRVLAVEPEHPGWVARYENAHSVLDLGAKGGNIGAGRRVPYLISATMLARRASIGAGFVEELTTGEDVDLGWRTVALGWRVIYDPTSIVLHDHRIRLTPFVRKRWIYGRSIGPLSKRHPGSLAPLRANALMIAVLAIVARGRPLPATAILLGRALRLSRRLHGNTLLAASLTGQDIWATTLGTARAVRRAWAPALMPFAFRRRSARRVLALAFLLLLIEEDRVDLRNLPLAVLDDLIAALSLWAACGESRVLDPLLPRLHT